MKPDINNISNQTIFRVLSMVLAFCFVVYIVIQLRGPLVWLGMAFFFALALQRPVDWLSSKLPRNSRGLAVFIVVSLVFIALGYLVLVTGPPILGQLRELVNNFPEYYNRFINENNPISQFIKSLDVPQQLSIDSGTVSNFFNSTSGGIVNFFRGVFSSLFAIFSTIVLTFFMVLEWPKWHELFWRYQDPKKKIHRKKLYAQMEKTVTGYVGGNLLTSLIAGIVTVIFLSIIGSPYAFVLGLIVAIFDLIPMFGAFIAAVIATLVVLVYGGVTPAIASIVFFIIYQQIENNILQPYVFSKTVNISPLVAGVAALFGASLAGLLGALVAIPIAASLQILVKDYLDRKYSSSNK